MYALDTETGPYPMPPGSAGAWALEPYRDEFYMKMLGVAGLNNYGRVIHMDEDNFTHSVREEIDLLADQTVYCHNTIFDMAVLIRQIGYEPLTKIKWRDTSLLAKWVNNSQKDEHFRYSLRNCIEKWLPDGDPRKEEFLALKDNIKDDFDYWLKRVLEDCRLTLDLAIILEGLLPPEQYRGYIIECNCLLPLARGWMQGILVDYDIVDEARITYQAKANGLLREIGTREAVLRSPKQLSDLLFTTWGLEPEGTTATGNPSTSADNLKMIALKSGDERVNKLVEAKQALTIISKYVNGFNKAKTYLNSNVLHPSPKLFNSYTGRMTYISKVMNKYQVGIAMHQLPRKAKIIKKAMVAPNGYKFLYMDFNAQELRIMAQFSNDKSMLNAFNNGMDLHSVMTEKIYGTPYEDIVEGNKHNDPVIVDQRNCGKLTNLSSMYRIGAKSLQAKFFTQYDKLINLREATHFLNSYKKAFRGIPGYWESSIEFARRNGYSASLADRRFYVKPTDWKGESSAINQPIQGSGADLSELTIAILAKEFPDLIFQIQVHDSLTWLIPEEDDPRDVQEFMNNFNFSDFFAANLNIQFPLDFAYGDNLADLQPL